MERTKPPGRAQERREAMYWLMTCRHRPHTAGLREPYREAHRRDLAMGGGETARFLIGSALTAYDGETTIGNLGRRRDRRHGHGERLLRTRRPWESVEIVALARTSRHTGLIA